MKDNVVDFEAEYYITKQKEGLEALLNSKFEETIEILSEPISKIDELNEVEMYCPQNIFEQAIFLNLLGKEVHQTSFARINYYDFYLMSASAYFNLEKYEDSKRCYHKAIALNPASGIARIFEMKIDLKLGFLDDFLNNLKDAMYFAYSRKDIGQIYELAGDYLAHEEDYEMAVVAYNLSIVYDLNDAMVDKIKNVAEKGNIDLDSAEWLSEDYMKKFYNAYKIPLMPNDKIVMLAEAMGEDSKKNRAFNVSELCFKIAYDLTLDEKYKVELDKLNGHK